MGLVYKSPRQYGYNNSLWSLPQLATVSFEQGLTSEAVSHETVRQALEKAGHRLAASAKAHQQPRPALRAKKRHRDRLVRWAKGRRDALLVWEDECWFSRFTQPTVNAGAADVSNRYAWPSEHRRSTRLLKPWPVMGPCKTIPGRLVHPGPRVN